MAQRVIPLTCQIQPNTLASAPQHFPLQFASADVERVDVRVPPGPSGLVGFSINQGGANYIPQGNGNWIIADDEPLSWPTDGAPNNGSWEVVAYNTDVVQHTIYVRFLVRDLVVATIPGGSGTVAL